MIERIWQGPERRRHPRHEACFSLAVGVEVYGFEAASRPFFARGTSCNISLGGVLARLDAPVSPGSVCNVFFRRVGERIRPHHLAARVLHCRREGDEYLVGIAFDEPLAKLDVSGLVAGHAAHTLGAPPAGNVADAEAGD